MNRLGGLLALTLPLLCAGQEVRLGQAMEGFTLRTLDGAEAPVAFTKAAATVVLFISTKCPVSNRYSQRMIDLYGEFAPKGVNFVFVNSNQNESAEEVRQHAREASYPFAVLKDPGNVLADRFGAQATPATYVLDPAGVLRYHGRIDDSQFPARIKERSLRLAIDAVLAGRSPDPAETRALGCTIKRVPRS